METAAAVKVETVPAPATLTAPQKDLGPIPADLGNATFTDIWRLASMLAKSDLLPEQLRNRPENVAVVLLTGKDLGVSPMMAVRGIVIIKGKPTFEAAFMRALVKGRDPTSKIEFLESNERIARARFTREGQEPFEAKFTIEEATKAGLTGKDNWKAYPTDMLVARVTARGCRAVWSDILFGVYLPDEIEDIAPPPTGPKKRRGFARTIDETMPDAQGDVIDAPPPETNGKTAAAVVVEQVADTRTPPDEVDERPERVLLIAEIARHSTPSSSPLNVEDVEAAYSRAGVPFDVESFDVVGIVDLRKLEKELAEAHEARAKVTPPPPAETPIDRDVRLLGLARSKHPEKRLSALKKFGVDPKMPHGNIPPELRAAILREVFGEALPA